MTRYNVIQIEPFDKPRVIDSFLSRIDALTYADMLNRTDDFNAYIVRHEEIQWTT